MNKIRSVITAIYRLSAVFTAGFITWKIFRHWHVGLGKKTGHTLDASIGAAAAKLEKDAIALEVLSDKGIVENLGKGFDTVLMDTKKTLENAMHLVARALKH
jgi:hypothetical protein